MKRRVAVDVDDNRSVWAATARAADVPSAPLHGEVTADIAIIGAGFTGLSTAYHLSARFPGRKVVVLEAKRVGNGASGRNGGMALNWIHGMELGDPVRSRRIFEFTKSGIDWIEATIAAHQLEVGFERTGCLECVTHPDLVDDARKRAEKLASWGMPIRFLEGEELAVKVRAQGVSGALFDPTAGQLHGLEFIRGLARVVRERGVTIYEDSPVREIDEGRTHTLSTAHGQVRADTMVLATNGYTPTLGYFRGGVFPMHSHCVATAPLPRERWAELGWGDFAGFTDDLDRIAYASMTPDGRLLFGGGGNEAYSYVYGGRTTFPTDAAAHYVFVESILLKYFPGAKDVRIDARWTGTLGITMSRSCSMGVMGEHKNILYALGYSGHGVVMANLAGQILCDLYSDNPEPWRDLPFFQKSLGGIPPDPFRWVGYHLFTKATGRSPRRYE